VAARVVKWGEASQRRRTAARRYDGGASKRRRRGRHGRGGVARRAAHHERQAAERALLAESAAAPAEDNLRHAPANEVLSLVAEVGPTYYAREYKKLSTRGIGYNVEGIRLRGP
jgi:hypothetical protein